MKEVIANGGGWMTDYRMFSNKSICIQFEISPSDVTKLFERLKNLKSIKINEGSMVLLTDFINQQKLTQSRVDRDIKGTFEVTFIHDDPDLIIEVPSLEL